MVEAAKKFYPYIPVNLLLKDKFENYKKRFLNHKVEILHVTEKTIDQDFYNGLLANRPSDDELRDLYQKNLPDYDRERH